MSLRSVRLPLQANSTSRLLAMPKRKTFAEMVTEASNEPPRPPEFRPDEFLTDPSGKVFQRIDAALSATRANELIAAGAAIAFDDCGCGGQCSVEWAEQSSVAAVPETKKRKKGRAASASLEEWRSRDGAIMVLVSGPDFIR